MQASCLCQNLFLNVINFCCLLGGENSFINPSTSKFRITICYEDMMNSPLCPNSSPQWGWTDQFRHCSEWVPGATISFLLSLFQGLQLILWAKTKNFNSRLICILAHWNRPVKSENQIIAWYKRPIKIEKPLQSLLLFSCSVGEGNILQTVLLSFFFSFYFLNALRSDNHSNSFCLQA